MRIAANELQKTAKAGFRIEQSEDSCLIEWSPGNGTCYKVLFVRLDKQVLEAIGSKNSYLIVDVNSGRSCTKSLIGSLISTYAKDKWGLSGDSKYGFCCIVNYAMSLNDSLASHYYDKVMEYS